MALDIIIPSVGESITEVTIASWQKENLDYVDQGDIICELESDKAGFEIVAEASGELEIMVQEGENVAIGTVIGRIKETEAKPTKKEEAKSESISKDLDSEDKHKLNGEANTDTNYASGHPSPAASKILKEKGLSTSEIAKGTGVNGRITKTDALNAQKPVEIKKPQPIKEKSQNSQPLERQEKRERLSALRKTIAKRLVSAKNETAMLTTFNEVDMKAIMDIRKEYKEKFKNKHEVGLGFMSFFIKATCIALQDWPSVCAQIDKQEAVYYNYCDVSIAVSSPRGLVVPVIRNAEKLSFDELEKEVVRLATKARNNKLSIDEMSGGNFTITNGGIFGSMLSTPIINAPQSAILGMHNIVQRPIALNGEVVIRPIMYLALSYDHRIIDGKESVSFLYRMKELLENPVRLLLKV